VQRGHQFDYAWEDGRMWERRIRVYFECMERRDGVYRI
jgi:hypothetical protein